MSNNSSPVKIGLIGAGARLRGVVDLVIKEAAGSVEVAAAFDPDPISQEALRVAFGPQVKICASEEELVNLPEIQWVFIGSFNCHHAAQAILAMEAGKDVFCEKPLATELEDCLRVRDVARRTGRTFSFGLVLRYSPFYQKIKELVASGAIGRLVSFEFNETLNFNHGGYILGNWRRHRELAGTHLLEKCCHDLDLANWITGELPMKAASFGGRNIFTPENEGLVAKVGPDENGATPYSAWPDPHKVSPFSPGASIVDNQVAIIQYTGDVRATFHTNCSASILERRFFLCGTEGTLRANAYTGLIEHSRTGWETKTEVIDTQAAGGHGGGDIVMARGLVKTLTQGQPPLASIEDGLRACIAAFGIDASMDEGRITDFQPYWDAVAAGGNGVLREV